MLAETSALPSATLTRTASLPSRLIAREEFDVLEMLISISLAVWLPALHAFSPRTNAVTGLIAVVILTYASLANFIPRMETARAKYLAGPEMVPLPID